MRSKAAKRAAQTRRVYQWSYHIWGASPSLGFSPALGLLSWYAVRHRTLEEMNRFTDMVMLKEAPDRHTHPMVWRGTGLLTSGCVGFQHIMMTSRQSCYAVLLHEIVHILGFHWHTPGFVKKYIYLLGEYANCEEIPLALSAGLYGVI